MKHTHAVDHVEAFREKRQRKHIRLKGDEFPILQILRGHFGGGAQVDAYNAGPPTGRNFGKPSHATAHIEHELTLQLLRTKPGLPAKVRVFNPSVVMIELRLLIAMPLKPETGRILLRVHKTRNAVRLGIGALAGRADETAALGRFRVFRRSPGNSESPANQRTGLTASVLPLLA